MVTSQPGTVDMTVTYFSAHRLLVLKSDRREKQFSSLCTAHLAPVSRRFPILHVMDSKGLFDAVDNDLPQDDGKSGLEVPIIEEFMRRAMCRPRWCLHNRNAADAARSSMARALEINGQACQAEGKAKVVRGRDSS